jgi:hypothetical protein
MTGQQLVNSSGRLIGELRGDRSFGAVESANLLEALNQLLASWSEGEFAIHQVSRDEHTSTGAASYTMGPSATINTTRPVKIIAAATKASSGAQRPTKIATAEEFAAIPDTTMTGSFAELLYPDYGHPTMTLRVFPKPASGSTLIIDSLKPLTAIASLATTVSFPPGYEQALVYSFAEVIAAEFGKAPSPDVKEEAARARAAIAQMNAQLKLQPAVTE